GRMLMPSSGEAIVGRGVVGRYAGAALGDQLEFGRGRWHVVGVFDAGGSSFESEVWVDVRELANDAKRPFPCCAVRIRVATPEQIERLIRRIEDDPRFALGAERETAYYAKQSESANTLYVLVVGIAVLAGIGAGFGAANNMYAAVQARTAEIGKLRAEFASLRVDRGPAAAPAKPGRQRRGALPAVIAVVLVAALAAWRLVAGRAVPVTVVHATLAASGQAGPAPVLSGSGYIVTGDRYVSIGVRVPGRIERYFVEEGQTVHRGDALVQL